MSTHLHRRLNGSSSSLHIFIYINKLKLYTCYFIITLISCGSYSQTSIHNVVKSSARISTEQSTKCSFTVSEVVQLLLFHDHMDFIFFRPKQRNYFSLVQRRGYAHIINILNWLESIDICPMWRFRRIWFVLLWWLGISAIIVVYFYFCLQIKTILHIR